MKIQIEFKILLQKNHLKLKLQFMAYFGRNCNKAGIPAHQKNKQTKKYLRSFMENTISL
jgi:hypothetical protein